MIGRTLLSFDPGGTTGFVQLLEDRETGIYHLEKFGEIPYDKLEQVVDLIRDLSPVRDDEVITEHLTVQGPDFDIRGVYVEGVIRFLCKIYQVPVTLRSPSFLVAGTKWVKVYPDSSEHVKDALRHAVVYLRSTQRLCSV